MKKHEFISELKEALEHNMSEQKIKEHVEYYEEYIRNEVRNGRLEEDVLNELGDPWQLQRQFVCLMEWINKRLFTLQRKHREKRQRKIMQIGRRF